MEPFRRLKLSSNGILSSLHRESAVDSLPESLHCRFARPSHDRRVSVRETMQFADFSNAQDLLSALFGARYIKSSNSSQGKIGVRVPVALPLRVGVCACKPWVRNALAAS